MDIICERCGANFSCQKDSHREGSKCWCDNLKLEKEIAEKISDNFCNCLCEKCLKDISQTKST